MDFLKSLNGHFNHDCLEADILNAPSDQMVKNTFSRTTFMNEKASTRQSI